VSESGDGGTSLGSGVLAKQLRSQSVYPGLKKAAPTYEGLNLLIGRARLMPEAHLFLANTPKC
jgi:hypothetical protein